MTSVTKIPNNMKEMKGMKKIIKNTIKFCLFISLVSLPFISVTLAIGLDTFLDSFENPEFYLCFQDEDNLLGTNTKNGEHVIIQRSTHPDFDVKKSDSIIYCKNTGEMTCSKIEIVNKMGSFEKYYTVDDNYKTSYPIYEEQIIGKVVNIVDDNLWNSISISVWEASINNLNVRALVSD
jgi:hypothetical protein